MNNIRKPANRSQFKRKKNIKRLIFFLISIVILVYTIFPIIWIFSASINPLETLATQKMIPEKVSLINYQKLFSDPVNPFVKWLFNSLKISSTASLAVVMVTALGAYALSRFRFMGRRHLLLVSLLTQVFPNTLAIIAIFLIIKQIGGYVPSLGLNTHGGLILVYMGTALGGNIWLMKGYFDTIPRDLEESAMIDGASHWQIFRHIILPLSRPMLVVIAVISFISTYGEVVIARVLVREVEKYTLAVGLWIMIDNWYSMKWGEFAAGALIGAIPIVTMFYILQKQIVSGLTQGAVKG